MGVLDPLSALRLPEYCRRIPAGVNLSKPYLCRIYTVFKPYLDRTYIDTA
jgi:hypothetical protein